MTGLGALFLKHWIPSIATIFTTHATSIGRSIAGNMKPLYDYMSGYNGDQMASELNMESKHSIEKQSAHRVDCFTTVSEITDIECTQLLEKPADVILVNGFEDDFVPKGAAFTAKRKEARKMMLQKIQDEVNAYKTGGSKGGMFPDRWLPAALAVLPEAWTEKNGLVNSTMKIVRGKVEKYFEDRIEYAYTPEGKDLFNPKNMDALK
jgi:hypothetical protein